jgi:antitoxin YefM
VTRLQLLLHRSGRRPNQDESLKETAYLLRSPENARRLLASITRLEEGTGIERDLEE